MKENFIKEMVLDSHQTLF